MAAAPKKCERCGLNFFWTEKEQVEALKSVKIDGSLRTAEMSRLKAPKRCRKCRTEKR